MTQERGAVLDTDHLTDIVRNFYLSVHFFIHPTHLDLTMLSLVSTLELLPFSVHFSIHPTYFGLTILSLVSTLVIEEG